MGIWDVDAARVAKIRGKPLDEAVRLWDRAIDEPVLDGARRERDRVLELFPKEAWGSLALEKYALGTGVDESFCKLLEFRTQALGGIGGGSAKKHLIFRKADGTWYHRPEYANELEAWEAVRAGFIRGFDLADQGDWSAIDAIPAISTASSLRGKTYSIYYPDEQLPIFSSSYQSYYYKLLGGDGDFSDGVEGTRALWRAAQATGHFEGWHPIDIARFLWVWSDPNPGKRIVKIAPGPEARFWDDCQSQGYICVGWDDVGDLREFESKDDFRLRFGEMYPDYSPSKATEKANEVWTLMELQPGDIILANQGTSRVLGRGKVAEPGYVWRPDRGEWAFHTVSVEWEPIEAWNIDPIRRWALTTVSPVSPEEYKRILQGVGARPSDHPPTEVPPDPLLAEIASTIDRKLQVVLYGPPGTGKTYNARRFSVWWLSAKAGSADARTILGDARAFGLAERRLSTAQAERRVWWIVANPAQWSWDRLETERTVTYRYGRLQRNYSLLQPGDLVVGYSANPDKRIAAIARVRQGLHTEKGERRIELEWVARVDDGLTWEELLADSRLTSSEPIRFRNQGTLFALTRDEADHLLAILQERNPDLPLASEADETIGLLTRVTFHPSYTYEDFVEGYKPIPTGTGQLDLRLVDGVFKRVCRAAQADPDHPYLLLIDEINRGNIPKIFGELITLLEADKRNLTVVLPQSRETFSVPPNVFLLGTMNTADRSIKLLDAALRRRFAFIELMPDASTLSGGIIGDLNLAAFLMSLNSKVAATEGREKQIGHSFLLNDAGEPVSSPDEFGQRFRYEILPLLQEYSYEDYAELESYIGSRLVNAQDQSLNSEVLSSPSDLLDALRQHLTPSSADRDGEMAIETEASDAGEGGPPPA
jgi:5-methylcytosine-specific restriction protein B